MVLCNCFLQRLQVWFKGAHGGPALVKPNALIGIIQVVMRHFYNILVQQLVFFYLIQQPKKAFGLMHNPAEKYIAYTILRGKFIPKVFMQAIRRNKYRTLDGGRYLL